MDKKETVDFGYQQVSSQEKTSRVAGVFHSVASNYDLMNDLMSLGMHRCWKRFAVKTSQVKVGDFVLDCAGGSGDLSRLFADRVGHNGKVILTDINASMLAEGRRKVIDAGLFRRISLAQVNAESLPFAKNHFDIISIGFGLRNVTDKAKALRSMAHCLKPGGTLIILEFSKPMLSMLQPLYDVYSFSVIPWLGELISQDAESYQYLAESIRMHPDQESLKTMILQAGFDDCEYHNLTAGIVAVHKARKY